MRKVKLKDLLYKMQIAGYQNQAYWQLVPKLTQGMVKNTSRVKRLRLVTKTLCILGVGFPLFCLPRTLAFANYLMQPWEKLIQNYWLKRAKRILRQYPNLIKIGITGSYGKTSVKNILAELLGTKYRVVASPASFNTPMGFARTVNQFLKPDTQVLIMEMGARRPGEIREMCQLVQPDYGIITSIGPCHLSTFGNIENVARTKAELFSSLPSQGIAVTDGDNLWCQKLVHKNLVLVKNSEQSIYSTQLLGKHQQKNIQLAVAMARRLGITEAEITKTVANLKPTPHRLAKIVATNGIIVLDDSYNANPASATCALDVLNEYHTRKVIQTPGFVEQGTNSAVAHEELCSHIKKVADAVIVVGELNRKYFEEGLRDFGGEVVYVPNRETAKKYYPLWLKSGDVLLILNDLPENY